MATKQCDIRYAEKSEVGAISVENIIWLYDDRVEIFQNLNVDSLHDKSNVSFGKDTAVRYARMILDKYEGK